MTKKVFDLNNTIPHSVHLVDSFFYVRDIFSVPFFFGACFYIVWDVRWDRLSIRARYAPKYKHNNESMCLVPIIAFASPEVEII
jgi:hypothetical protein